jgi:MYXO-CTERM domain-containing protein
MTPDASRGWFTAGLGLAGAAALALGRLRRRK